MTAQREMGNGDASVRPMVASDLVEVAHLHEECLEAGFFGRLGNRFMRRYYETFVASPHAIALAVGERPVAMLVGTTNNELHYRWVFRTRGLRLAVSGGLALLRRPAVLLDFVRTRLRRYLRGARRVTGRRAGAPEPDVSRVSEQVAVLTHVAVSPSARRQRLGAALVEAFVGAARRGGAHRALLVTLEDSGGSEAFYISLGWDPTGSKLDNDGRSLKMFQLSLKDAH